MAKKLKTVQHHVYNFYGNYGVVYNYSSCMYEIDNARSTYIMPFKEFVDLKTNLDKYGTVQAWYFALTPESKKDVVRVIKPPLPKAPNKRRRKKQTCCSFTI